MEEFLCLFTQGGERGRGGKELLESSAQGKARFDGGSVFEPCLDQLEAFLGLLCLPCCGLFGSFLARCCVAVVFVLEGPEFFGVGEGEHGLLGVFELKIQAEDFVGVGLGCFVEFADFSALAAVEDVIGEVFLGGRQGRTTSSGEESHGGGKE